MDKNMLNLHSRILVGAVKLEEAGESPFTLAALTLAAWKEFPDTFGLEGYEQFHPDVNKVGAALSGTRGMVNWGLLRRVAPKTYTMTPAGRESAYLAAEACKIELLPRKMIPDNTATKPQEAFLDWVLGSAALEKAKQNAWADISFPNACQFWGISTESPPSEVQATILRFGIDLENCKTSAFSTRELVLSTGRSVSPDDLREVEQVNEKLLKQFDRHLKLYRLKAAKKEKEREATEKA